MSIFDKLRERREKRDAEYAAWLEKAKAQKFSYEEEEAGRFDTPEVLMLNLRRDMRARLISEETCKTRRAEIWAAEEALERGGEVEYFSDERGFRRVRVVKEGTAPPPAPDPAQLERWLEAGRIDKEEYKKLKG